MHTSIQLNFEPIDLKRQSEYLARFDQCTQKVSDYSFVNLWSWAEEYGLFWSWTDDLVFIKQTRPEIRYWAPVGQWENLDWTKFFEGLPDNMTVFTRVPEALIRLWQKHENEKLIIEASRDHFDYLYDFKALVDLRGNKFHKKKNLLNQFKKKYTYQFVPLDQDIADMAMALQEDWCTWRDCESSLSLSAENNAIKKVLINWNQLQNIIGGAILVEEFIAAFTVAENLDKDTLLIHFEKGCPQYKGIYQAINNIFLSNIDETYQTVNREQDLGDDGLRKAKESYHPIDFLKKYNVVRA